MCFCCLSQPLKRTFWNSVSTDRAEPSPSNWSCSLMSPSTYSLTNQSNSILIHQDSAFLTNLTARIWSSHLRNYGPIKDQKGRLCKSAPLGLGECPSLPPKTNVCISLARRSTQSRWRRPEQSCPAKEEPHPWAALPQGLFTTFLFPRSAAL